MMHPSVAVPHPDAGRALLAGLLAVALGCAAWPKGTRTRILRAPAPSAQERYCAWYGDAEGDRLYVGLSAFWSAMADSGGDPVADLRTPGPQLIGRFDLAAERHLPPLRVDAGHGRSGVWDVLVHGGRLYFTTFYQLAGSVGAAGELPRSFPEAGRGLAELAPGSDGGVVATRYAGESGHGSVVVLGPDGRVRAEHPLAGPDGVRVAPKSVAWDPARGEYWVTTDLLTPDGRPAGHDARVLDAAGRELLRYAEPELQFVLFAENGTGYLAESTGSELWLRILPPGPPSAPRPQGRRVLLDPAFPAELDFAQELRLADDGTLLVTRWSGAVHLVDAALGVHRVDLPRPEPDGLYYSAVLHGRRLCATYCAGVTVVCRDAPAGLFR